MDKMLYKLDVFEGPLDLLLHLIAKNKLDIKDIQISLLLDQYIDHIRMMEECGIYVRSEFLNMVSRLIYIKTISLLPKTEEEQQELKKELTQELTARKELKEISSIIGTNIKFDIFTRHPEEMTVDTKFTGKIEICKLINAYVKAFAGKKKVVVQKENKLAKIITRKIVSVYSKVISVLRILSKMDVIKYMDLFQNCVDKSSLIATFLAILELIKVKRISIEKIGSDILVKLNRFKKKSGVPVSGTYSVVETQNTVSTSL